MRRILESQKPVIVMVLLRFVYSGTNVFSGAALMQGMSPRVFVAYRQALGFMLIAPIAFFRSRVTVKQNMYYEGLFLASSSMASAMGNIIPAVNFILAYIFGIEKINMKSMRSIAKIIGTIVCVTGAVGMVLLRGPKIVHRSRESETWLLGCLLLFTSEFFWSTKLLLQVPVSKCYPDHASLTAWFCFLGAMQSAVFAFFVDSDLDAWKISSALELGCLAFAAAGSVISFLAQTWAISERGPLFSAMFSPLTTVITTFFASTFAHEEMYLGSFIGAIAVILGLYVVLWGKAKDHLVEDDAEEKRKLNQKKLTDEITDRTSCIVDLEEPLLSTQTTMLDSE